MISANGGLAAENDFVTNVGSDVVPTGNTIELVELNFAIDLPLPNLI